MECALHEYSTIVSKALDTLGYSFDNIKVRQAGIAESFRRDNDEDNDPDSTLIVAGSKAEGVTSQLECDLDYMISHDTIVCCEDVQEVDTDIYEAVFVMDKANVAPGYTRLRHADWQTMKRLSHRGGHMEVIVKASFRNENGDFLLSSEFYFAELYNDKYKPENRAGPAITLTDEDEPTMNIPNDSVISIPFKCKSILKAWISRPRSHDWPAREVIQEISTMDGHVVPVGFKGSDKQFEEWRICYTQAETRLVVSFSETQLKLYVLLKMVAKKLLKPVCPDITSYITKNMMFWLSEDHPQDSFKIKDLMVLLMFSLSMLRTLVETEYLENYMIPARNLFAGKLERSQKQKLLELLSSLITEGPTFILQYPELDVLRSRIVQVYRKPELALYEQKNREEASRSGFRCGDAFDHVTCITTLGAVCADNGVDPEPIKMKLFKLLSGSYN